MRGSLSRWTEPDSDPSTALPPATTTQSTLPFAAGDVITFQWRANTQALLRARTSVVIEVLLPPSGLAATAVSKSGDSKQQPAETQWLVAAQNSIDLSTLLAADLRVSTAPKTRAPFAVPLFAPPTSSSGSASAAAAAAAGANAVVGELYGEYFVIDAWQHPLNDLSVTWRNYWNRSPKPAPSKPARSDSGAAPPQPQPQRCVDMGHRGLGRSHKSVAGQRRPSVAENSLLSFDAAAHAGAEYVEVGFLSSPLGPPVLSAHGVILSWMCDSWM